MADPDVTTLTLNDDELMLLVDLIDIGLKHPDLSADGRRRVQSFRETVAAQALTPAARP